MESEKPHRSGIKRRSSDFFLCFSSRSSSSSSRLKVSSRSMLSPGRGRESAMVSLSSSLSRRLRNNGSMKGGQGQSSPMFPTGSKKKGCSFETQEPSSPKVTCIGQVRVKTKKKKNGRKMRTRSKRRSGGGSGEVSFRKGEDGGEGFKDRNQRWVHLPLTICEALRGFGAEFNCFSPCGGRRSASSWCNSEREKADKRRRRNSSRSCGGAVFARWLFAIDGEEKREKEMHLEEERQRETCRDGVREIEVEISEEDEREEMKVEAHKQDEEDEEARVSICIPPKNALLLMRCRSEPFRSCSLANRFWDSPAPKEENVDDNDDDEEVADGEKERVEIEEEVKEVVVQEEEEVDKVNLEQTEAKMEEEQVLERWVLAEESENQENPSSMEENLEEILEEKQENPETEVAAEEAEQQETQLQEEIKVNDLSLDLEVEEKEMKDEKRLSSSSSTATTTGIVQSEVEVEAETQQVLGEETETEKKRKSMEEEEEEDRSVSEEVKQMDGQEFVGEPEKLHSVLPDCLLLMMCEPKLSMEVSKETWVCSTDFIRGRHNPEAKADGGDEKKRLSTDGSKPAHRTHPAQSNNKKPPPRPQKKSSPQKVQPPRASCSEIMGRASGPSVMASMIEKKLVNAVAYEPLVLTRCKSEPMRSSAKLAPEACFWKNRKLELHPAPPPGLGAAGVGF